MSHHDSALGGLDDSSPSNRDAADSSPVHQLAVPASLAPELHAALSSSAAPASTAAPSTRVVAMPAEPLPLSKSPSFLAFRSSVQRRTVMVGSRVWAYYDLGPRDSSLQPLLCLPGTSGTAECFFFQLLALGGGRGYRVLSATPPAYDSHDEWLNGFNGFLRAVGLVNDSPAAPGAPQQQQQQQQQQTQQQRKSSVDSAAPADSESASAESVSASADATAGDSSSAESSTAPSSSPASSPTVPSNPHGRVHVLAAGLSGFLCLYYVSHILPQRNYISSLILCNAFADTREFQKRIGGGDKGAKNDNKGDKGSSALSGKQKWCLALLKRAPDFFLRKTLLDAMPSASAWPEIVDFAVDQLDSLDRDTICSRLLLHLQPNRGVSRPDLWRALTPDGAPFPQERITILDSQDESSLPEEMRGRLYDLLPRARYAFLKQGGDMPFLSVPDEVNLHLQLHLRANGVFPDKDATPKHASASETQTAASSASPASATSSSVPASASPPSTVPAASSSVSPHPFLHLSSSSWSSPPALFASGRHAKLGYGHEDDDVDSIFLRKSGVASTLPLATPDAMKEEAREERERSELLAAVLSEAAASDAKQSDESGDSNASSSSGSAATASASTTSPLSAEESERLAAERRKEQIQAEVLSQLLDADGEAAEEEQRLTKKRAYKKQQDPDNLF